MGERETQPHGLSEADIQALGHKILTTSRYVFAVVCGSESDCGRVPARQAMHLAGKVAAGVLSYDQAVYEHEIGDCLSDKKLTVASLEVITS